VTTKISGYKAPNLPAPLAGSGSSGAVAEKASATNAAAPQAAASAADQVTFTGSAQTLQKLGAVLAKAPIVNAAKVASVKQSVKNGTYTVNAGSVADKLLQFDGELK
jgi:negative regulator of flagellin synthesis FlgM